MFVCFSSPKHRHKLVSKDKSALDLAYHEHNLDLELLQLGEEVNCDVEI